MVQVISVFLMIVLGIMLVGLVGRVGTDGLNNVDDNVAASLGFLMVFCIFLFCFSSNELSKIFGDMCGGIPYVSDIVDYGSLVECFKQEPLRAANSFLEIVCISFIIESLSLLPLTSGSAVNKFMVKMFTGIVLALAAILIFNYIIADSNVYKFIVNIIGAVISFIAIGSVPIGIISVLKNNAAIGRGLIVTLLLFSKTKIIGILRSSFLKAVVFVLSIWFIETNFKSVANFMSGAATVISFLAPSIIVVIGIGFLIKSIFR